MRYRSFWVHTKCGGEVNVLRRTCTKCKKKWGLIAFLIDPTGLRIGKEVIKESPTSYSKWADKLPYVGLVAERLPDWPKWARILSLIVFLLLLTGIVFLIMYWSKC